MTGSLDELDRRSRLATTAGSRPVSDANRLGLDFRVEAEALPFAGPIHDVHTHITSPDAADAFFAAADRYGIDRVWTMTPLRTVDAISERAGDRLRFIAVPDFLRREEDPEAFRSSWFRDLEGFAERGCRIAKLWAAPRGLDFDDALLIDSPVRIEGVKIAKDLGMMFMTHVGDPDTWFATKYADEGTYYTKRQHFERLERLIDMAIGDTPVIGAHMGGTPEDLDLLQSMLDRYPNYYVDTSATKWQVRELSKHPGAFADFCRRNAGRVLFGTDIVANDDNRHDAWNDGSGGFDLYASRFWALRTLIQGEYDGPSPIVDPDLRLVDPSVDEKATATLRGAGLEGQPLDEVYHAALERLLKPWYGDAWGDSRAQAGC